MSVENWTMAGMLADRAANHPTRTALVFHAVETSYDELNQQANAVANGLVGAGVIPGSRVAILDLNSDRYFQVFFGTTKVRGALVGINTRLAPPEVAFIVNDAEAEVLFVGKHHIDLVEQIESELSHTRQIVALDGNHARWPSYEQWRGSPTSNGPQLDLNPEDDIIQLYTSGTTGHPKGVCHNSRQYDAVITAAREAGWGVFGAETVMLVAMPTFHVAGFNLCILTLNSGGKAVISEQVDPGEILQLVPLHKITDTFFVPAVILALLSHADAEAIDLISFKTICYGAAPMAGALLEQARSRFGCDFVHLYGLTENLGAGTCLPAEMHDESLGKLRSIGIPYPGSELRVIDQAGEDVPVGEVGEIIMRSPWVMRCYWKREKATASTVIDGWLHSGDAGYLDEDGYLYIHDRVKDMIVSGGENVYPAEVENALFSHPAIADVAVIGVPDDKWGETVKAVVVLKAGESLTETELIQFARTRIAGYKIPRTMDLIDELPRNASGKVLKRTLREPYWAGRERQVN